VVVVLFCVPAVVPVTFTEKLQEELAANVAPDRLTEPDAAVAVMAPLPQEPARPLGVEITSPAGSVSVKPTPVSDPELELVMVKPRLVPPPTATFAAPNTLLIVGGLTATVTPAVAAFPVPPLVEVTGCVMLFFVPDVMAVTFTANVHEAFAANVPAVRLAEFDPAVTVGVPPQVLARPLGVAISSPTGKVSVKATPLSGALGLRLVMVKVRLVLAPTRMLSAPNALLMVGGRRTNKVAVAGSPEEGSSQ
jgi:hypothetical protein